ncbi:hypothetical protein CMO93_00825 [Candidatus Woesearchaeota archaeon]|nr:hypothetical protein [Candidatus Woesearchaeota archaeon]|tara:strand:- start:1904 stop:2254 length:351 start_codon:yes stop_codon:yes gene_type:complete
MNNIDKFNDYIEKIKKSNILVIVEGEKDAKALQELGIKNTIELSKKPLFGIIEKISSKNKDCIILTDLDKKGKELYGKLNSGLQEHGVRIDNKFREFLFRKTKIRQIEGINGYLEF